MSDSQWSTYHEAFVNVIHKVMGRKLRPFSLYHQLWLEVIGSPLLDREKTSTPSDLEIATRICSADYGEVEHQVKLPPPLLFGWRWRGQKFDREMMKFVAYLNDYNSQPDVVSAQSRPQTKGNVGDTSTWPDSLGIVCSLMRNGFSEQTAWMCPVGKAVWYSCGFARAEGGDIRVKSALESEFERRIKQQIKSGELDPIAEGEIKWSAGPPRNGDLPPPGWNPHGD